MRTWLALAAGAALTLTPLMARAADLCLELDAGDLLRFTKVKRPGPGKVVPLQGIFVAGLEAAPFHGAAYARQNGQIKVGIFVHSIVIGGKNLTLEWTANGPDLSGTALYDNAGSYQPVDSTELTPIDCSAVPLP